jgi:hypothetical protein
MSRATTLTLTQDFAAGLADVTSIDRYYDDVVFQLGAQPWLTESTLVAVDEDTATYSLPDKAVRLLHLFYDDAHLMEESLDTLSWQHPDWRDQRGRPLGYTRLGETARTIRLWPTPDVSSKDFIFLMGAPFGRDFPEYAVVMLHTEVRDDLPAWLELPVALRVLAREFSQESDHRDTTFAEAATRLADTFMEMLK